MLFNIIEYIFCPPYPNSHKTFLISLAYWLSTTDYIRIPLEDFASMYILRKYGVRSIQMSHFKGNTAYGVHSIVYSQPPVIDGMAHFYANRTIATNERRNHIQPVNIL
jgi:hypothetical protein